MKKFAWDNESPVGGDLILPASSPEFLIGHGFLNSNNNHSTERRPESLPKGKSLATKSRPPSGKLGAVIAPVNATPIGAYTQMKKALGALSVKDLNNKGKIWS